MNKEEQAYLDLMKEVLKNGEPSKDRTGTGTLSIFGPRLEFSLKDGKCPILTTKKIFTKSVIEELIMFLQGNPDTGHLLNQGIKIWEKNTTREFLDKRGLQHLPVNSLGKGYSWQWRNFGGTTENNGFDQIAFLVNEIKTNPTSRRLIVSAINPLQASEMPLEPCHCTWQMYVRGGKLSCHMYQRSADAFLGVPFNIASYGILTHLIAKMTGLIAEKLIVSFGDFHIYNDHVEQVKEQLSREPFEFPTIEVPLVDLEFKTTHKEFVINNYQHHPAIKANMSA